MYSVDLKNRISAQKPRIAPITVSVTTSQQKKNGQPAAMTFNQQTEGYNDVKQIYKYEYVYTEI